MKRAVSAYLDYQSGPPEKATELAAIYQCSVNFSCIRQSIDLVPAGLKWLPLFEQKTTILKWNLCVV